MSINVITKPSTYYGHINKHIERTGFFQVVFKTSKPAIKKYNDKCPF